MQAIIKLEMDYSKESGEERYFLPNEEAFGDEISNRAWQLLQPIVQEQSEGKGRKGTDDRTFLNGVFWVLRSGARWREMPQEYGKWNSTYQRFKRWRDKGVWEKVLEVLWNDPEFKWLVVDNNSRYVWPWMQMVCRSEYLSQWIPRCVVRELTY